MNSDIKLPAFDPTDPNGNRDLTDPSQIKWDPKSEFRWEKDTWDVMRSMTRQPYYWIKHQIESFNNFIDTIPLIIANNSPIIINKNYVDEPTTTGQPGYHEYRCVISFKEIFISPPLKEDNANGIKRLLPSMARQRDLTYAATLYVDVHQEWFKWDKIQNKYISCNKPDVEEKVPLAKIPIMLGSKYCYLHGLSPKMRAELGESEDDEGGYFIVNGTEKVVIAFERPRENTILVYPTKGSVTNYTDKVEVKSTIDQRFFPIHETSAFLQNKKEPNSVGQTICVKIRYVRNDIPLFVAFRALGIISDKAIMEFILYSVENPSQADMNMANLLLPSAEEANKVKDLGDPNRTISIRTQEEALQYIAHPKNINYKVDFLTDKEDQRKARLIFAKNILDKEFLPHMNPPNGEPNNRKKAFYLGHMIRRLLECHLGMQPYNDRDHYDFKRANTTGALLAKIFSPNLKRLNNKIRQNIQKQQTCETNRGLRKDIQSCTIETALKFALSTGNWATSKSGSTSSSDKGVAQVLQRMTPYSALSHLRRVMSPLDSTGSKLVPPRKLHPTQFGLICPNETPEGEQVGIVKNLALSVNITIPTSSAPIYACLNDLGIRLLEEVWVGELKSAIKVFVNGHFYGILKQEIAAAVYQELKLLKRDGTLDIHTSISWNIDLKELHVLTDGGRYCRPFYIVEENKATGLFEPLIARKWKTIGEDLVKQRTKWHSLVTGTGLESSYCKAGSAGMSRDLRRPETATYESRTLNGGVIEYLDTTEISMAMVAIDAFSLSAAVNGKQNKEWYRYNYLEIHPICMLGVISQMTPFSDHNPSPRNCYQCLDKNTLVLMADGTKKCIKDIKVGDQVISVDPETYERLFSTVVNQFVKPTDKQMLTLTLISGRQLTCTADHPILTQKGWIKAEEFIYDPSLTVCVSLPMGLTGEKAVELEYYRYLELMANHNILQMNILQMNILQMNILQMNILQMNYIQWSSMIRVKGTSIFMPVFSITKREQMEIADITIDKSCHSFITGEGIVVHNSSMGKQALGIHTTNYNSRYDTNGYVLLNVQRPLVNPRTMELVGFDKLPTGQQIIVAIMNYTGYNQEDSVMLNGAGLDRGRFNTLASKTHKDKEAKKAANALRGKTSLGGQEQFMKPDKELTKDLRMGSYEFLDESGLAKVGSELQGGDIIIGKTIELSLEEKKKSKNGEKYKDISKDIKKNEYGTVDKVLNGKTHQLTNSDGETLAKVRVTHLRKPIIGDKFACSPSSHEVLCSDGWKSIADVSKQDKVATLDPTDNTIHYVHPTGIHEYAYKGDMYEVKSQQVDLLVTPSHKMYVCKRDHKNYELIEARHILNKRVKYQKDGDFKPIIYPKVFHIPSVTLAYRSDPAKVFPAITIEMKDWVTLFGIWIAEGCASARTDRDDLGHVFIAGNKPRVQAEVDRINQKYNLGFTLSKTSSYTSTNTQLYSYLRPLSVGALNKSLPTWVWNLSAEHARDLIEGLMLGDGYKNKSSAYQYYTSSELLADDVQRLALHAGWAANIYKRSDAGCQFTIRGKDYSTNADALVVTIVRCKNRPEINHGHIKAQHGDFHDHMVPYDGKVYCITVPTGVFYIRHNGIAVWTGNSRSAQKGTCGMIYNQADIPFTSSGLQPDLIMNPHAIPSRMTIGQIIESQASKLACMTGEYVDGSSFIIYDREGCEKQLTSYGLNKNCDEIMYDPRTGDQISNPIFITPTYYQRLKHMVDDKMHARDKGPVTLLTRQPQEGRSRDGGLRLGEMERDAIIAHSLAFFLKERLVDFSDIFRVYVSKKHKAIVMANPDRDFYMYNGEMLSKDEVSSCQIPYAFKLLLHEIASMGVDIALHI
jgi:DNA-directed RNA polymerase beta subunit